MQAKRECFAAKEPQTNTRGMMVPMRAMRYRANDVAPMLMMVCAVF